MPEPGSAPVSRHRLYDVRIDTETVGRQNPNVEHEREVAIFDLLEGNAFRLEGRDEGPYQLEISIRDERLIFKVGNETKDSLVTHLFSLNPFRKIIKDYFLVCDSYYEAIRTAPPSRIQAIDMGRKALHDEGSRILIERFEGKIDVDADTARRLFTLICALHWKG